ncbi:MAG: acyltransferase [Chitinophagaceae bacterium]
MTYFPGLDGMRAIAAFSVILFHLYPVSVFHLGWAGVDFFFVISGFLITNILLSQKGQPGFFKLFYIRRALRIFPLYFLVIIPLLFANIYFAQVEVNKTIPYLFYLQNFSALQDGYLTALGHTWSLAVEEQYYLLYPALIFFVPIRKLMPVLLCLIAGTILLRTYLAYNDYNFYYQSGLLFTRADSLMMGGLLPLVFSRMDFDNERMSRLLNRVFIIGLLLLAFFIVWQISSFGAKSIFADFGNRNLSGNSIGQLKYTILAIIFSALIGQIAYGSSSILQFMKNKLETPFIKYLGKISYGLYLFHIPVNRYYDVLLQKLNVQQPLFVVVFVKISLTILISAISWKFFESPILKLKSKFSYS